MLKILKLKLEQIKLLKKNLENDSEINNIKLEIYSILLGYYARRKDRDIFKIYDNSNIEEIVNKINNILNTNILALKIKDNTHDSMKICIKRLISKSPENIDKYNKILKNFEFGYDYYDAYFEKNNSIFDYLLLHKPERLENKVYKIKYKTDII
ncbi:MAG: hypothetical protein IJO32_00975 [Bacilli bacterium]|nr:hypothetical protein [Bacilli bacterium]